MKDSFCVLILVWHMGNENTLKTKSFVVSCSWSVHRSHHYIVTILEPINNVDTMKFPVTFYQICFRFFVFLLWKFTWASNIHFNYLTEVYNQAKFLTLENGNYDLNHWNDSLLLMFSKILISPSHPLSRIMPSPLIYNRESSVHQHCYNLFQWNRTTSSADLHAAGLGLLLKRKFFCIYTLRHMCCSISLLGINFLSVLTKYITIEINWIN